MTNQIIKISVHGATGRIGKQLLSLISEDKQLELTGTYSQTSDITLDKICENSQIIIDFSLPKALPPLLAAALQYKTSLVIGTTGFSSEDYRLITEASLRIPILYSANMSYGIAVLNNLLRQALKMISQQEFDVTILDKHHKFKKDSPSGTALMLGNTICENWYGTQDKNPICQPIRPEKFGGINFSTVKIGNIIGEHEVTFANLEERITLSHVAEDRKIFAQGAIKAAKWLFNKPAGLYSLSDLLKL